MSQLETHQGLPSLLLYRRPASLMETRLMYGQWIRDLNHPQTLWVKCVTFQSGAFSFEMHGATIFGRYERHWSITSPRPSFPLDLRGRPPVCVKSERPLKQLCVNRWLSVPQRCFQVCKAKPQHKSMVEATRETSKEKHINDRDLMIWSDQSEFDPDTIMRPEPLQCPLKFFELCDAVKPGDEPTGWHDNMKESLFGSIEANLRMHPTENAAQYPSLISGVLGGKLRKLDVIQAFPFPFLTHWVHPMNPALQGTFP